MIVLLRALFRDKYISDEHDFPWHWVEPGEVMFDPTGYQFTKGNWTWLCVKAWWRRSVLGRERLYWMQKHWENKKKT